MKWKSLSNQQEIDLVSYVKEYIKDRPEVQVLIGTDSQVHGKKVDYALVVAFHSQNTGGHIVYAKQTFFKNTGMFDRLMREVQFTIEVGELLRISGVSQKIMRLHFDLNTDEVYKSNEVLRAVLGWAESMSYSVDYKPFAGVASRAADMLCK